MNYQNYEDYMRSVLGYYQMPEMYSDMYEPRTDYYYERNNPQASSNIQYNTYNTETLNMYYPEIYKIVYPMICKICNQNQNREVTKELIDSMTEEIYRNVEDVGTELSMQNTKSQTQLKNGDVRNPNAKESEFRETRQSNFLLRDLIRILILREFLRPGRPPIPPRPPIGPRPPMPPRSPRNPWGGMY